jgi:hypothetical protein
MSDDILEVMAAGMTGRFWWLLDGIPQQPHTNGHIRRDEAGYWVVEVEGWRSMENGAKSEDESYPDSMMGVLGKGTVFLSDRRRLTDFSMWSGQRIHVVRSTFETAVTGLDVNTVEADGITEAEVLFPNQNPWDRSDRPNWRWREADDPLGKGISLDVPTAEATKLAVGGGVTLTVRPTWWPDQEIEQIRINSALSLKLSAAGPKPTADLVEAFEWMQDLIGHCWGGRVVPVPGAGKVNDVQEEPGRFWSQRLFERHHVQLANLSHPFPAVYLPDLGGPRAFVRWLILCRHFSRATRAVSEGLYVGASAETRLLNAMAAVEYWVKRHEARPDWVKVWSTGPVNPMHALIRHLKPAFTGWVRDGAPFSRRVWGDYNWLKHNPEFEIDYTLVRTFTWAAEAMLLADLLNEVAGTAVPGNRLATHRWPLRDAVQELLRDRKRSAPPPKWTNPPPSEEL